MLGIDFVVRGRGLLFRNKDTSAVLADDEFLTLTYLYLTLWRDAVEATTTSVTLYGYDCQTIMHLAANTVISREQTLVNLCLCLLWFKRCARSLYKISLTSELLPEPETPVTQVRVPRGICTLTFLRLFCLAPNTLR